MVNRLTARYRELTSQGRQIVDLISGNPNDHGFIFPPEILEGEYERYVNAREYRPDPKGDPEAREAIREYYADRGARFSTETILLTSGTSESYFHLFSHLAAAGETVLVPQPSYPLLDQIAALARVSLKPYALREDRGWRIDVDQLAGTIDSKTRAIVLVSPHNPTGTVHDPEEIRAVVWVANQNGLAVICDEVFCEFVHEPHGYPRVAAVARPGLLFTLNGISKMFALPGLKLGWIAVSGESGRVADAVDALETSVDTFLSTGMPIQKALPAIFREGAGFKKAYIKEVAGRRQLAIDILRRSDRVRFHPPRGGFYITAEILGLRGMSEEDLIIRLMEEEGVFIHPGYFYDIEGGTHVVVSCLARPEVLREGLGRLLRYLEKRGRESFFISQEVTK